MPRIRLLAVTASAALAFCAAAGASPDEVLYDQHDNAGTVSSNSQDYESALNTFDTELADDFAVPAGPGWNVTGVEVQGVYYGGPGPATSVNVRVYANGAGSLPGTLLASRLNQTFAGGPSFVSHSTPRSGCSPEAIGCRFRQTRTSGAPASGAGRTGPSRRRQVLPGRTLAEASVSARPGNVE
jgi:hypothetical protein